MSHPVAIIQARMGGTRLPGKVLLPLCGYSMLWHIVQRCRAAEGIAEVVVATTDQPVDDTIVVMCQAHGIPYCRGSEHDVLDRYHQVALRFKADPVLRVTADCPMVDHGVIAAVLQMYQFSGRRYDIVGAATGAGAIHTDGCHFPDGVDVECYSFACLERLWHEAQAPQDREHVSTYALRNTERFAIGRVYASKEYGHHRWTVDYAADFALVTAVYEALWMPGRHFGMEDVVDYLATHPGVYALNRQHVGKEGYEELWAL
mgnify:CR=1 FL=1